MKIYISKTRTNRASTLMIAVVITGLVGFVLAAYLTLLGAQNNTTVRSQVWNSSIPVIEAGCEEALAHLNLHGSSNLLCDGWTFNNGQYTMTRWVDNQSFYTASISNFPASPTVVSLGYVPMPTLVSTETYPMYADVLGGPPAPQTFMLRGVRLTTTRSGLFAKAMVAKGTIALSGNVLIDSYDSSNPLYSTNGLYDATKRRDNGDVASDGQVIKDITVSGSLSMYGHISTGPGGTVGLNGAVASIGDTNWVDGGNSGIKPGWFRDDMNVSFHDVAAPFNGGAFSLSGGLLLGTNYTYVLGSGKYQANSINMNSHDTMLVTGNAVLYVTGNLSMTAQSQIIIAQGGSLKLYVAGTSGSLAGQGVANGTGNATNFIYYGMPNNTSVTLNGGSGFTGIIYAPRAALNVAGGSTIYGSTVSSTVSAAGGFNFHYDESLANYAGGAAFIVTSWNELTPSDIGSTVVSVTPPPR